MAKEGSYEIVINTQRVEGTSTQKQLLSGETLCLIEQSRAEDENIVLSFEFYNIIVYPKNKKK
jgi:hypothetical protein